MKKYFIVITAGENKTRKPPIKSPMARPTTHPTPKNPKPMENPAAAIENTVEISLTGQARSAEIRPIMTRTSAAAIAPSISRIVIIVATVERSAIKQHIHLNI